MTYHQSYQFEGQQFGSFQIGPHLVVFPLIHPLPKAVEAPLFQVLTGHHQ